MWVQSLGWEDPLKKGMATHSSILFFFPQYSFFFFKAVLRFPQFPGSQVLLVEGPNASMFDNKPSFPGGGNHTRFLFAFPSILEWRAPWTEELSNLQCIGSQTLKSD